MAVQEKGGLCETCNRQVMVRRKGTNHIFHFIMSLVTMGLWIIPWILISIKIGGWRCTQCGGSKISQVG